VFEVRVIDQEGYFLQTPASFVWEIVELTVEESVPEPEPLDISTSENIEILTPEPEATTTDEIATTTEDIVTTTEPVIELEPESTPEPEPVDISTSSNINISSLEPEPEFLEPVE